MTRAIERELIANQIHDDPIQAATVLSLMLQRLERDAPDQMRGPATPRLLRTLTHSRHQRTLDTADWNPHTAKVQKRNHPT